MASVRPWSVRAEGEVIRLPQDRVEGWARFDAFFVEEHERLFKALYFVTGNREDAEELMQEAFLRLWERWHEIDRIDVRMLTYRQLCEWFALYTNLGCDSRAEGMCIVFEMNMTAPEADTDAPHHKAA